MQLVCHDMGLTDTIVAQATARAPAAIAIVRLAGARAQSVAKALCGDAALPRPYTMARRRLVDAAADVLDDAMVVLMPGPASYTGDDVVELHLHGAQGIVQAVLAACREAGARDASAGEFTQRAFVNGRMDLTQAEAVGSLLTARGAAERRNALQLLRGGLSRRLEDLLAALEPILARWRTHVDFPDERQGSAMTSADVNILGMARRSIQALVAGAKTDLGRPYQVALCGSPNAGKSTLLNAWAADERALVDAMPGTTRDPIAVDMADAEVGWVVWDTAGLRVGAAGLEARGIALAEARAAAADCVLWLVAAAGPEVPGAAAWPPPHWQHVTVVISMADLAPSASTRQALADAARQRNLPFWGFMSVHAGEGVAALRDWAVRRAAHPGDDARDDTIYVAKARHVQLLQAAADALGICLEGHDAGLPLDLALGEVELAARALGAILGRDIDAAVLEQIFSSFCIGK